MVSLVAKGRCEYANGRSVAPPAVGYGGLTAERRGGADLAQGPRRDHSLRLNTAITANTAIRPGPTRTPAIRPGPTRTPAGCTRAYAQAIGRPPRLRGAVGGRRMPRLT
jgi:hypothetical protein